MKKILLYSLIGIVVIGTAGYFIFGISGSKDVRYRTEKVSRGIIVVQVRATGTINPVKTVQVGSQVSGTISRINVDYNSQVKKGEVIAVIDSTMLYANVKEAQANLARNQAQVNEAKRSLGRTEGLFAKQLVSQADLDAATTGYESAVAQLAQTQAALDRAAVNLRYATIRAPIDGVVISRDVDVGQTVAASLQTPKLFEIANDLKQMQVEASVDEADVGQIATGQRVTFTVDAYPDEQFRGSVTQIRLAPVTVQNVVTYTVIIDVPNPDLKLRPGMTATVSILVDKRENALRVPVLALRFQPPSDVVDKEAATPIKEQQHQSSQRPDSSRRRNFQMRQRTGEGGGERHRMEGQPGENAHQNSGRVWVIDASKNLRPVDVTTGLNDNRYVEIIGGGLQEGDEVALGMMAAETASGNGGQQNPFGPRGMGGPGGGGGGRR